MKNVLHIDLDDLKSQVDDYIGNGELIKTELTDDKLPQNVYYSPKLTKEELAHSTWTFLHGIIQNAPCEYTEYGEIFSKTQYNMIINLLITISKLYPCSKCRDHFGEMLMNNKPKSFLKKDICYWVCNLHNQINKRNKKPIFLPEKLYQKYNLI